MEDGQSRSFSGMALLLSGALLGASLQAQSGAPPQDPQRPVFRAGTNLVRVDAYPSTDGKIIQGLTVDDFELLEDGVPQKIDSFQFIQYDQHTPSTERRDPHSQRDAFQLAADPSYRVFVIYLDNLHVQFSGSHAVRQPLVTFLNRVLGRNDLFGVLTTRHGINGVSAADGTAVATTKARIEPGSRAATIRIPLQKKGGPFEATIRVRNDMDASAQEGLSVERRSSLFGDPLLYRLATPTTPRPAGSAQYRRTERIRVQWPLAGGVEEPIARLLGRDGVPLELQVALSEHEEGGIRFLVANINLAPLTAGDCVIEVSGKTAGTVERAMLAFRVSR